MMNPSKTVELVLAKIIETSDNKDLMQICTEVDDLMMQKLARQLLNPKLTLSDKFQIIADLAYCSDFLEDLIHEAQDFVNLMSDDPYYLLIRLIKDEDVE